MTNKHFFKIKSKDIQQVFPTHIFIKDNDIDIDKVHTMKDEVNNMYRGSQKPNWQSGHDLHENEVFKYFLIDISKSAFQIIDQLQYKVDGIQITDMWANVLKPGETHQPHTHSNNFLSGVFYLDAEETSGITFQDPRPAAHVIQPSRIKTDSNNASLLNYQSKTNRIIIFPSWLVHWVPINQSTRDRISISWNIQLKGRVGEHHEFQSGQF